MASEHRYSTVDRLLHRIAFATLRSQLELGDLEDRLYARDIAGVTVTRPVFITALPRAGTTLLLEICASVPEFATHTYRHMPFVLLPLMWGRFSSRFHQQGTRTERAHGDGMLVGPDSPEAFEEMIWKTAWRDHYASDRIFPWDDFGEQDADFRAYFSRHLRKIIAHRRNNDGHPWRYVSKNNGNIARVDWLRGAFPDATVIVPIRDPLQHAASLLRQHTNFLAIHAQDAFACKYMAGIGHFDFGENLRPINFGNWLETAQHNDPTRLGFWLEYWVAAYEHLLARQDGNVHFLCFDRFCADPAAGLAWLAGILAVDDPTNLLAKHSEIRPPADHAVNTSDIDDALLARAQGLFARCQSVAFSESA